VTKKALPSETERATIRRYMLAKRQKDQQAEEERKREEERKKSEVKRRLLELEVKRRNKDKRTVKRAPWTRRPAVSHGRRPFDLNSDPFHSPRSQSEDEQLALRTRLEELNAAVRKRTTVATVDGKKELQPLPAAIDIGAGRVANDGEVPMQRRTEREAAGVVTPEAAEDEPHHPRAGFHAVDNGRRQPVRLGQEDDKQEKSRGDGGDTLIGGASTKERRATERKPTLTEVLSAHRRDEALVADLRRRADALVAEPESPPPPSDPFRFIEAHKRKKGDDGIRPVIQKAATTGAARREAAAAPDPDPARSGRYRNGGEEIKEAPLTTEGRGATGDSAGVQITAAATMGAPQHQPEAPEEGVDSKIDDVDATGRRPSKGMVRPRSYYEVLLPLT